jgi:hypothetical protein
VETNAPRFFLSDGTGQFVTYDDGNATGLVLMGWKAQNSELGELLKLASSKLEY